VDLINKLAKAGRVHLVLSGCSTAADGHDRLANMVTTRAQPLISAVVKVHVGSFTVPLCRLELA
jgi:hypothetical protein